jgi:hypothetical protein
MAFAAWRKRLRPGKVTPTVVTAAMVTSLAAVIAVGASPAGADSGDGTLTVQVERDFLGTGVYDAAIDVPQAGMAVDVSDTAGHHVTGTTDASGMVTVPPSATLVGGQYRVTVSIPAPYDAYLQAAPASTADGHFDSFTSFVDVSGGTDATVTTGVWNPADYVQPNAPVAVPVQASTGTGLGTVPQALVTFPYNQRGVSSGTQVASQTDIGTTLGVAYQRDSQRLFASAFAKRHAAYGPGGPGAIYVLPADGSGAPSLFTTVPDAGDTVHDLTNLKVDAGFFDAPGKEGLGGMALSEDGSTLYVVNLHNNTLYAYDATGATAEEPQSSTEIPDPGCAAASDWHASAVAIHDGVIYTGGVCSGQSTQDASDMRAVVYRGDGTTFTEIVDQALDFQRGNVWSGYGADPIAQHWNPWISSWDTTDVVINGLGDARPQPEFGSIAVEADGSLVLGFRDRFGDQTGFNAFTPDGTGPGVSGITGGDINKVCLIDGSYDWEGTGGCPANSTAANDGGLYNNGATEYFPGDFVPGTHYEAAQGAVALPLSQPRLISTELDPIWGIYNGGVAWYDRTTGLGSGNDIGQGLQLIDAAAGFGKANGLGDIAILADNAPVQIGNRVWYDANRDGVQDADEIGLPGVTVNLLDDGGDQVATTTTDADGEYYFGGAGADYQLTPGANYTVQFNACAADTSGVPGAPDASSLQFTQATAGDDPSLDSNVTPPTTGQLCQGTADVTAPETPGTVDHTIDAGLYAPPPVCAVGQVTFVDTNGNGVQDGGEPPLPGVTVALFNTDGSPAVDADGNPVSTVTDGQGRYALDNLVCGQYYVVFTPPAGYEPTQQLPPSDSAVNSTPDETGQTPVFTTAPGEPNNRAPEVGDGVTEATDINPTIDAGYTLIPTCTVGDLVWLDGNGNGIRDAGEVGVPGVTVTLLDADGNPVPSVDPVVTGGDGSYSFAGIPCGAYEVEFSDLPPGDTITQPQQGNDPSVDSNPDPDTGITPPVTVTPDNPVDDTIDAGVVPPPVCAVGDVVWFDANGNGIQDAGEAGAPGVTVTLLNPDGSPAVDADGDPVVAAVTDGQGRYVFDNLACAQYEVAFTDLPDGYVFTSAQQGADASVDSNPDTGTGVTPVFTVDAGQPDTRGVEAGDNVTAAALIDPTIDAGLVQVTCTVGDFVWLDSNRNGIQDAGEAGVAGVTVTLLDADGNPAPGVDPVPTGADGSYSFADIPCGAYEVEFSDLPDGDVFTQPQQGNDPSVDSNANPDTGITPPVTVTPDNPVDDTVDAGILPPPVCAVGQVTFVDTNGNGVQDAGEPPLPGVTVALFNPDGSPADDADGNPVASVTTNDQGQYVFDNLTCGQYYETFTPPAGYEPTQQLPPSDSAVNSTPDETGQTPVFTIEPGQPDNRAPEPGDGVTEATDINPTIDAGYTPLPSTCILTGVVWIDSDHDGTHDSDERGQTGVTVTLLDADGNPVTAVDPVQTGADGSYTFADIPCGAYELGFSDLPPGVTFTNQSPPSDPDGSTPDPGTGITPPITTTPGAPTPVNAGVVPPVCAVGDVVWLDSNGNGIQDADEPGVAGVTVTLLNPDGSAATDVDGNPVASTTTDDQGRYVFDNLACAQYEVAFSDLPDGYVFTEAQQGDDASVDSNPDAGTGTTPVFTVDAGQPDTRAVQPGDNVTAATLIDPTIDAGLVQPTCTIGDLVWFDGNGNGIQDAGEAVAPGVTVTLLDADGNPMPGVDPVVTGADGSYSFAGIPCGTYEVAFSGLPDGDNFTQPQQGDDSSVDSNPDPDTGITPPVTVTPDNPVDDTIDAGIVSPPPAPLPDTGVMVKQLVATAILLLVVGGGLVVISGRRRRVA